MFRSAPRQWLRLPRSVRPGSTPGTPRGERRAQTPNNLDIASLALQLIQVLPTFWAGMLLVGFGGWISPVLALGVLMAPATWWLLRLWRAASAEPTQDAPADQRTPHAEPPAWSEDGTALAQLHDDVTSLVGASLRQDPVELLPDINDTTKRIQVLLDEDQYPRHRDRLHLLAGMGLCVATDNRLNFGDRRGAAATVRLARTHAEIIDHLPMQAWCCSVLSWILALEEMPRKAAQLAVSGQRFATTAVSRRRLHGMHGNALALMGDRRGALRAFDLARIEQTDVMESDDIVDRIGGVFSAPVAKQYQNAAYGLTRLGLFGKAATAAEKAIQLYAHGPEDQRDYVLESGARISLAMSQVMRRQLDAAGETLRSTLDLPSNRRTDYLRMLTADLNQVLAKPRFNRSGAATQLRTELEEFAAAGPGPPG